MLMRSARGVSMVELVIALAIFSLLLAAGIPAFGEWLQNTQIRTAAESIQNGLQMARNEAVRRNTRTSLYLTTTADNSCALATTGPNWVVSVDSPVAACASAPSLDVAPRIVEVWPSTDGAPNVGVTSTQSTVTFNGLGRQVAVAPAVAPTAVVVNVTNSTGGTCVADGGDMRCLRVLVSVTGQIRMCDPARATPDPQAC